MPSHRPKNQSCTLRCHLRDNIQGLPLPNTRPECSSTGNKGRVIFTYTFTTYLYFFVDSAHFVMGAFLRDSFLGKDDSGISVQYLEAFVDVLSLGITLSVLSTYIRIVKVQCGFFGFPQFLYISRNKSNRGN